MQDLEIASLNPSFEDWPSNDFFQSAQKKQLSKASRRSSWASKWFSTLFIPATIAELSSGENFRIMIDTDYCRFYDRRLVFLSFSTDWSMKRMQNILQFWDHETTWGIKKLF